jgi:hypothetical protein
MVTMPPRAVFGARTGDERTCPSSTTTLNSCGGSHCVIEAADPHSPLRVARTYFFCTGAVNKDVFAGELLAGFSSSSSLHFQLRPACGLHEYTSQAALEHTQATITGRVVVQRAYGGPVWAGDIATSIETGITCHSHHNRHTRQLLTCIHRPG